jgi:hypothetical protein
MKANDLGISPAPWTYDDNREGHEGMCAVFDAEGNAVMGFGDMEDCEWAAIADGKLCAAAPDLYEALEFLLNCLDQGIEADVNPRPLARAALAKARGSS